MLSGTTRTLVVLILIALPKFVIAQEAAPVPVVSIRDLSAYADRPRVQAVRLNSGEAIAVDGSLDEAAWRRAGPATDFIQQDPDFGKPATERTEVRFVFGRGSLYMGVTCYDSEPDKLMGNTMQRDAFLNADDRFMWTFDPYLNGRSGYFFEINPSGAMGDSLLDTAEGNSNNSNAARAWDGIWYAKTRRTGTGWTIEIEIPFRTLNFDPDAPAWGVNFQRTIRRKNEETLWTGWVRNEGLRRMSNAGLLEGISSVSQGAGLDVQPYVTGVYTQAPGRNVGSRFKKDGGVDFVYSITPRLKANFTVNTDFAETEVDQRRVNLTRFPLFFPEKRSFFLEGSTFFDFAREQGTAITPFFSRQIGLDANGQPQRIDYGTKLTGQIGPHDIGILQVRTAASGDLPGEDFSVARAKRRFFRQSYAGVLYTRRAARGLNSPALQTAGIDFQLAASRFRGANNMNFSGWYLWNTRRAGQDSGAYGLRFEYPNDLWDIRMAMREVQPGYSPAAGFVQRTSYRRYNPDIRFSPRPKNSRIVRRFSFRYDDSVFTDLKNRLLTREMTMTPLRVEFQDGSSFEFRVVPTYERLEKDFEISSGVRLPGGGAYDFTRYEMEAATANRRVVAGSARYENGAFYSGRRRDFIFNVGLRPRTGVLINLENEWARVALAEGRFSTKLHRLNVNTQFSPWISAVNNLQYDSVSRVLGWQTRFRWIVRPGNDVYIVYNHNWLEDPSGRRMTLDRSAATKVIYTHRF